MNVLNGVLIAAAILLWMASLGSLEDLHGSDPAGNGLASAFGLLASMALWIVLPILLVVSALQHGWPRWTMWAALVLVPACAVADFVAIDLLNDTFYKAQWPLVVPQAAPVLLTAWAVWACYPSLRAILPAGAVSGVVWGAMLILALLPWPARLYRASHREEDQTRAAGACGRARRAGSELAAP